MTDEREEHIQRLLGALAHEPVQASESLKERLVQALWEEQTRRAAAPAFWRALWVPWPAAPRWAYLAVGLLLGLCFFAIAAWPVDRAILQVQQGVVQVQDSPGLLFPWGHRPNFVNQQQDIKVTEGAAITLPEDGAAVLSFFNRSQVELSPGTQMTLTQAQPGSLWQPPAVRMQVETGEVRAEVAHLRSPAERFEVTLPTALVSVRGTIFRAWVISATHTCVATDEGIVLVRLVDPTQGYPEIEVPAGYEVHAILGQPLSVQPQGAARPERVVATVPGAPNTAASAAPTSPPTPSPTQTTLPLLTATPPPATPSEMQVPASLTPTPVITPGLVPTLSTTDNLTPAMTMTPVAPQADETDKNTSPKADTYSDLVLLQTSDPNPAAADGKLLYTLKVRNYGNGTAERVIVTNTLPAEVRLITTTFPVTQNAETFVWPLGTLAPGEERMLLVKTQVQPWVTQPFTNTAWLSSATHDAHSRNNHNFNVTQVTTATDLVITRMEFPGIVSAGDVVTCVLNYANLGPAAARSVSIALTLSPNVRFENTISAQPLLHFIPAPSADGNGTLMLGNAQPQRWTLAELPADASGQLIFTVKIAPETLGWLTNTVSIGSPAPDPQSFNSHYRQTLWAARFADLAITRFETSGDVVTGEVLAYSLDYTNRGPWAADDVVITGILPPGVTFGGMMQGGDLSTPTLSEQKLVWTTPALLPGGAGSLVFTATVHRATAGSLLHTATIDSATAEARPGDERASAAATVRAPALRLDAALAPAQVAPRMPFTLTVQVTNTGDAPFATGALALTPTWPLSVTYLTVENTELLWTNTAPLTPGQSLSYTLSLSATDEIAPGLYLGAVAVTGEAPAGTLIARRTVTLTVATPSVTLTQAVAPLSALEPGTRTVTFTVTLVNDGPAPLTALPLQDFYPGDTLCFVAAWPAPDTISPTGMLLWSDLISATEADVGLAPGVALSVTVVFAAPPTFDPTTPLLHTLIVTGGRDLYGNIPAPALSRMLMRLHHVYIPMILRRR